MTVKRYRMHPSRLLSRREILTTSGLGFGGLALAYLLHADRSGAAEHPGSSEQHPALDLRPKAPHFPARARAIIQLMQNGSPSQMDLFDPKPELQKRDGQPIAAS